MDKALVAECLQDLGCNLANCSRIARMRESGVGRFETHNDSGNTDTIEDTSRNTQSVYEIKINDVENS